MQLAAGKSLPDADTAKPKKRTKKQTTQQAIDQLNRNPFRYYTVTDFNRAINKYVRAQESPKKQPKSSHIKNKPLVLSYDNLRKGSIPRLVEERSRNPSNGHQRIEPPDRRTQIYRTQTPGVDEDEEPTLPKQI